VEKTSWKLSHVPVILDALAADSFPAARFPSAVALLEVLFFLAFFHHKAPK
jgi:hypothetical protein